MTVPDEKKQLKIIPNYSSEINWLSKVKRENKSGGAVEKPTIQNSLQFYLFFFISSWARTKHILKSTSPPVKKNRQFNKQVQQASQKKKKKKRRQ